MAKTPLEQILTYGKRLVAVIKRGLQARSWIVDAKRRSVRVSRWVVAAVNVAKHVLQSHPWMAVGVTCALVLACLGTGVACYTVDRSPLISGDPASSAIVQRQEKAKVFRQLLGDTTVEGGSAVDQLADREAQQVMAHLCITVEALQELPAASSAPTAFSLLDRFGTGVSGMSDEAESESTKNTEGSKVNGASDKTGTESSNAEIDLDGLTDAIQSMESSGYEVGCFFMNLDTGAGVAYNLDTRIYGASSFKGIYAAYLSEHLADGDAGLSASARSLMDASVRYSDNNAFSTLRNTYDGSGFASWIESCGVDSDIVHDTHFPRYSARESALLWFHTYRYLESGTDAANHLREIYTQTNTSFIREGVNEVLASEQDANEESANTATQKDECAVVMNKAGWIASSPRFSGLCDAGIIECDGQTYLMSVMTSAPDSSAHRAQVIAIIEELFKLR